ncbi:aminotransferase class IV [Chryseobacterium sp.]|uniref:aminotransferase class IV n=1 Tax=Chryseobacterium sp. TaxID=1871047 RepID=UPI0011CAD4A6|nr:aminotransferase class IV [Chryseobacterium sp.]TXF77474.1 aminodeoxychorismate lyase [Chryseobacterium sp.]
MNTDSIDFRNRAFLYGDAVWVSFFVRNGQLILAEECYFFLMASMRKMRMNIPLTYTLEFFQNLLNVETERNGLQNVIIRMMVYRQNDGRILSQSDVLYHFESEAVNDILSVSEDIEIDLIKEISVNTNLLSSLYVHSPENIYAGIYAAENDLDDVIFLNPNKRIARSIDGNLLFLEGNIIKIPKQTEGAYISPLMENLVTFIHKKGLAEIVEAEIIAFESQKAEEILMVSDMKGIKSVSKIRNKTFGKIRFTKILNLWQESFDGN